RVSRLMRPTKTATLIRSSPNTIQTLKKGTFPEPCRSTHASAAMAYKKVAVKVPIEWYISGSRAIQRTKRGEYATELNCTMTNTRENTIPVNVIIPVAMAE